jgi:hypothetical protein
MARYCGAPPVGWVAIDRVAATLAIKDASMPLQMADEIAAFH